jgi:hypothetical protein
MKKLYTGMAWKHHISEHFENYEEFGGAGKGGTIFIDYNKMLNYLKEDGRNWHIAELNLYNEPLIFKFKDKWMANVTRDIHSDKGFKKLLF